MVLGLLSLFFVARILPPGEVGVYFVAFAIANATVVLFAFGLPHAFAVRAVEFGNQRLASSAMAASFVLATLAGAAIWGVLQFSWRNADLAITGIPLVPVLSFAVFLNIMGASLLRSMMAFRWANLLSVLPNLLFNGALSYIFARGGAIDAAQCLLLSTLPQFAMLPLLAIALVRQVGLVWPRPREKDIRSLFRFGGTVHIGNILKEVMYRSSLIIVQILMGPVAAATFGLVSRLVDAIAKFVDAICLNLVPFIASNDREAGRAVLYLTLDFVVAVFLPGTIVVAVMSTTIVPWIFGPSYSESAVLLQYAIFAILPLAVWKILANDTIARVDLKKYLASAATGALAMPLLNFGLIPLLGLSGAVAAMLMAYCLAVGVILIKQNLLRNYVPLRAVSKIVRARWKKGVRPGE